MKQRWWLIAAGLVAVMNVVFAVANIIDPDDGPLWGRLVLLGVMVGALVVVGTGTALRQRGRAVGSTLIAIGVLPGAAAVLFVWFPPAVLYGLLALATVIAAAMDAGRRSAASTA